MFIITIISIIYIYIYKWLYIYDNIVKDKMIWRNTT